MPRKGKIVLSGEIKTQFVRDRLKETSWLYRGYIHDLQWMEKVVANGGPSGYAGAMCYRGLKAKHPVEHECIRLEINEGVYTCGREFRRMLVEHIKKERARSKRQARIEKAQRKAEKLRERAIWLEAKARL